MKKIGFFAVIAMIAAPCSAMALNINSVGVIKITKTTSDQWQVTPVQLIDQDGYEACRYRVQWWSHVDPSSTATLYIDEVTMPGFVSCAVSSTQMLSTVVVNAADAPSEGFDQLQKKRTISALALSEDVTGIMTGIIQWNGGDVRRLTVKF